MALINSLNEGMKTRNSIHNITDCSFYIFFDKAGKKFLQLDTYGSSDRENPGKVSQSLQFSEKAISELKKLIEREF